MDVGLRSLKYFIAVAEEENVSRAAARLHIAQPALSRRIRELEDRLGMALFDHSARSIRLTAAGRHFLEEARDVVTRFNDAVASLGQFHERARKIFRVGYVPSMSATMLPELIRNMHGAFPMVRVTLLDLNTEEMAAGVREGELDAALMVKPGEESLRGIAYTELATHRPCVVASSSHPLAGRGEVSAGDVAGQPLVTFCRAGYPEHHAWLEGILGAGFHARVVEECDSVASFLAMVESNCGVGIVQEGFANLSANGIVALRLRNAEAHRFSFGVACKSDDASDETRAFVNAARESAAGRADIR